MPTFSPAQIEEIILMAWADTVPFEAIEYQYGLNPHQLETFMRRHQTDKTYRRWRKRVETRRGSSSKHANRTSKTSTRTKY